MDRQGLASHRERRYPRPWIALAVLMVVGTALLSAYIGFSKPKQLVPRTPERAAYVWQRQWTSEVREGIARAAGEIDSFMVLGGEAESQDNSLRWRFANLDWAALAATGRGVWVVLRAHELAGLDTTDGRRELAASFATTIRDILDQSRRAAVLVRGFQLDYDSPTEELGSYAAFLHSLRQEIRGVALSVTALPAWLRRPEFAEVLRGLDHYVLQVHSLDKPRNVEEPVSLCVASRVPEWIREASMFRCPFYVALPTYGYRLFFDASGEFAGLAAEGTTESFADCSTKEVLADAESIAGLVRALDAEPADYWLGFAWFRLPVAGDRLNWTWTVLEQVMAGRVPKPEIHAEARSPSRDLYEVWVRNTGPYRPPGRIRVPLEWSGMSVMAHDFLGGYNGALGRGVVMTDMAGNAPPPGEEVMAAWFRVAAKPGDGEMAFHVGAVEVLP